MLRRLIILLGWLLGLFGVTAALFWLVLSSSLFNEARRSVFAAVLSGEIGQPLIVSDDVRMRLGRIVRVYVGGVQIPSETIDSMNLAELKILELDVDLVSLVRGKLDIDNLSIDGLLVNATTQQDGTTSWSPPRNPVSGTEKVSEIAKSSGQFEGDGGGILAFLGDRTVSFKGIGLKIDNQISGFSFEFDLSALLLEQREAGQLPLLTSEGTVNGEAFKIDGKFPRGKPFAVQASFGQLRLDFDGKPLSLEQGGGYLGTLTLDTGEIGEVLDILRLDRVLEGNGRVSANIRSQPNVLKIGDLKTDLAFADGSLIKVMGNVGNLLDSTGFDISVNARLHPENKPPARAVDLKSLKLTGIRAHITSQKKQLKFDELTFLTNAFDQALKQVGPVKIGRILRTPEGLLSMLDISLQMGPPENPFVVAKGELTNVLQLNGLEVAGKLTAPASLVLRNLP